MTDVLTDIMILESGNQAKYNYANLPEFVWKRDYNDVCNRHGIDTAQFRKVMVYYQAHPDEFSVTMEKVIARLQKMQVDKGVPNP